MGKEVSVKQLADPRVLSDEAVLVAVTSRLLRLLADGLLGQHGLREGLEPTDPKWINIERAHAGGAVDPAGLDALVLEQAHDHPEHLVLAAYLAQVITTPMRVFPLDCGSFQFVDDLQGLPTEALVAWVYALPVRLQRTVVFHFEFLEEAVATAPPDLHAAMGMLADFAHEPIEAPPDPHGDDPRMPGGMDVDALARMLLNQFGAYGPEGVVWLLETLVDGDGR